MNFVIDYEATVRDVTLLEGNNMHCGFIQNEQFISTASLPTKSHRLSDCEAVRSQFLASQYIIPPRKLSLVASY